MQVVVADTGPINYLVQIGAADVLQKLFGRIIVAAAVRAELTHPRTPTLVRTWIAHAPAWLEIGQNADPQSVAAMPPSLDEGERATIAVASAIKADLILMDDREGVKFARAQGFAVTGTLGVLDLAAQRDLINLAEACMRLRDTTFHYRQGLLDALLAQRRESES